MSEYIRSSSPAEPTSRSKTLSIQRTLIVALVVALFGTLTVTLVVAFKVTLIVSNPECNIVAVTVTLCHSWVTFYFV